MKLSPRPPKAPSRLSDSLHHQLNTYALAAGTAGVGILALAQPSEAKVVYTPAHKWLPVNQNYYLDLNHDGVNDFKFMVASHVWTTGGSRSLTLKGVRASQLQNEIYASSGWGSRGTLSFAAALPAGKAVGPRSPGFRKRLHSATMFWAVSESGGSWGSGPWGTIKGHAYLGVRFAIKGKVHYGWARLGPVSRWRPAKALLTGYAYETIPNKAIITGKTKGPDVITVQPGSLGHLAAGRK